MDTSSSPWSRIAPMIGRYPSPHNTQPIHLRIDGRHDATVLFDTACALPAHPLGLLFAHVTTGVYVESASVAAHALGFGLDVDTVAEPVRPTPPVEPFVVPDVDDARLQPVARLRLHPLGDPVEDLDPALLGRRRTSRLPYDHRDVPLRVLAELDAECARAGHRFGSTGERHQVARVVDLNQRTLFDDLATPAVREELRAWVRFSSRAARRRADGFSPECLVTPGLLLRSVFTQPRLWSLPPMQTLSRRVYLRSMQGTPRIAWVRGPMRTPADAVAAGRLLIRLWLRLEAHGVAVHPFGSVVTNDSSLAGFEETVGTATDRAGGAGSTWMVLRLGYSATPPESLRRPLHTQLHHTALADEGVR
jgi:hypothetical protein